MLLHVENRIRKGLRFHLYSTPSQVRLLINPGPVLEEGTIILTLWSLKLILQDSAPAVGTEGGQAVW